MKLDYAAYDQPVTSADITAFKTWQGKGGSGNRLRLMQYSVPIITVVYIIGLAIAISSSNGE